MKYQYYVIDFINPLLNYVYGNSMNVLFGIECREQPLLDRPDTAAALNIDYKHNEFASSEKQCVIYNFDKNEGKEITPFRYQWENDTFTCITAYNERLNVVYSIK